MDYLKSYKPLSLSKICFVVFCLSMFSVAQAGKPKNIPKAKPAIVEKPVEVVAAPAPVVVAPKWEQEPDAFAGIKLNAPLSGLVPCPVIKIGGLPARYNKDDAAQANLAENKSLVGCYDSITFKGEPIPFDPLTPGVKPFHLLRPLPVLSNPSVVVRDGVVVSIYEFSDQLAGDTRHYQLIKDAFIARYGEPHKVVPYKVKTVGGSEFDAEKLFWSGENVSVSVDSMADRRWDSYIKRIVESVQVSVSTLAYLKEREAERQAKAKEAAASF